MTNWLGYGIAFLVMLAFVWYGIKAVNKEAVRQGVNKYDV